MEIRYKVDVLKTLKGKKLSTYQLRKQRILGERTIQQLRKRQPVSWDVIARLCELLSCDVGNLLTVKPEEGYPQGKMGIAPEPPLDSQNIR